MTYARKKETSHLQTYCDPCVTKIGVTEAVAEPRAQPSMLILLAVRDVGCSSTAVTGIDRKAPPQLHERQTSSRYSCPLVVVIQSAFYDGNTLVTIVRTFHDFFIISWAERGIEVNTRRIV
jgi:hypothetical protein